MSLLGLQERVGGGDLGGREHLADVRLDADLLDPRQRSREPGDHAGSRSTWSELNAKIPVLASNRWSTEIRGVGMTAAAPAAGCACRP